MWSSGQDGLNKSFHIVTAEILLLAKMQIWANR